MSERYVPQEAQQSDKEDTRQSLRARLDLVDRLRKSGEVLKSNEHEPVPGATGDDSQHANPAATDDANQNNGQSDSTTAPVSQSDNQQQRVDAGQSERERLQRIEQARAEIAEAYAKGDRHASFRPGQS
jgi:hypothetical protein